jgi:hypothetical protein
MPQATIFGEDSQNSLVVLLRFPAQFISLAPNCQTAALLSRQYALAL